MAGYRGTRRTLVLTPADRQVMFLVHICIDLTVQISCVVTLLSLYNYLSKWTIEPDSRIPLFMVCQFQSMI